MCDHSRRMIVAAAGGAAASIFLPSVGKAIDRDDARFIAEAERMKQQAIAAGDQGYGAVMVRAGEIIGYGPSRVVADGNPDAHAERVALWEAQRRTGSQRLEQAVIYSTSRLCLACQHALAQAGVARMRFGPEASDGDPPRGN